MTDSDLFPSGKPDDKIGVDRFFEQYKLAVEMWDRVRARRQTANAFYVTINAAVLAVATAKDTDKVFQLSLSVAGLAISVLWIFTIVNYKILINGKYDVISRMEDFLPSTPFRSELLSHRHFTLVERLIPIAFFGIYVSMTVIGVMRFEMAPENWTGS